MKRYNPAEIEPKWQKIWDETQVYKADLTSDKPKYIAMSMFNYPSGNGIHIGHAMNYTISDVMARFKRQQGYESYHPVGWDAFGLPAENFAIKSGISPQQSMAKIIPSYHTQYKAMGWSNDWSKEISTHLPEYYRWTQWIFAEMFRRGMAYQDARMQWWCTKCQTVLANEQVIDGKCWRHDAPDDPEVHKKEVKQWFFKVTDYANEMLEATYDLDWSEVVKTAQINWIGKSEGAEVRFAVAGKDEAVTVFTTRPDTLFGATFMVLAPEHDMVKSLTTDEHRAEVEAYVTEAGKKSEVERQENKVKTGVFTGSYAINPVNGAKIPIWIADYVLVGYGTGAIMAVPAHDERDHEFAEAFSLPIIEVVSPNIEGSGKNRPREGIETVDRPVIHVIIRNTDGKYLLQIEADNTHFVGGGTDGEDDETAVRREILEEVGFDDIASIRPVSSTITMKGFRIPKGFNQHTVGRFYEVVLGSDHQVSSEIDEGKHTIEWVSKEKVAERLTWEHHLMAWKQYLEGSYCWHDEGVMINSGEYDGMPSAEAREKIVADLVAKGLAEAKTNFRIRDWSVSRQRYWGAPIPIINCPTHGAVLDDNLPVILPELEDFQPSGDGRSALARATDWLNVPCPICGEPSVRETDTLDTYICSSWYELRYFDPENAKAPFDSKIANKWMPIDFYNGGDHATAHLIYVRFIARFFHKIGLLENPEPFKRFLFNGKVKASDGTMFSKSKGNGVDPLEIIDSGYGADALRTYLMFAAPLDLDSRWDPQGVPGTHRFLSRIWNLVQEFQEADSTEDDNKGLLRIIHPTIRKVTEDLEVQKYNTAIATMMKATNDLYELKAKEGFMGRGSWRFALESLIALVAPFAPHMADEIWQILGSSGTVQTDSWPQWDDTYLVGDTIPIVIQINGKVRAQLEVPTDTAKEELERLALENDRVKEFTGNKKPTRVVVVPGRLVNIVV